MIAERRPWARKSSSCPAASRCAETSISCGMNQFVRSKKSVAPIAEPLSMTFLPPAFAVDSESATGVAVTRTVSRGERLSTTV